MWTSELSGAAITWAARTTTDAAGAAGGAFMHIPDGFLSTPVSLVLWVVAVLVVGVALVKVNRDMDEKRVPLMGVMAAAIFAGQMLNFAVTGGTSGHLLGAAIATALLGPWAAIVVMTCVVGPQAILFQAGGLLALERDVLRKSMAAAAEALPARAARPGFREDVEFALAAIRGLALLRAANGGSPAGAQGHWAPVRERRLRALA